MDSCVTAAIAAQEYHLYFLHITYGQRTEKRELDSFHKLADHYQGKDRMVINMEHLARIGGSALTDKNMEIPKGLSEDDQPTTYVPFRNSNLLSIAVSWAETVGAEKIYIGATEEDSAGYPDCRQSFYDAFNRVIKEGTQAGNIEIITPIINMNKTEIVKKATALNAPLKSTWSCYEREDKACGECDSCLRRLRAFKEAGMNDPIEYVD
jgi:7-cyano-7-deazaguanine synthase